MKAIRLENGNLRIPLRAESEDGIRGDGVMEIDKTHKDYARWLKKSISEQEARERGMLREK